MKYIIMCGGKYEKWKQPRQFTEINGETLVGRTIRLLKDEGIKEIYISTNDERFKRFGVPLLKHDNKFMFDGETTEDFWVSAFYPANEPATYLMGDVFYSETAIHIICETQTDDIEFFASAPPFSKDYIKPYAEPFGFKVVNQKHFQDSIKFVKRNFGLFGRHPISWELWQVIKGTPLNRVDYSNFTIINDYTCDIDSKEDAEKLKEVLHDNDSRVPGT